MSANYKWQLVGFLFCIGALNYGDRTAISSVFPLLRKEFNATDVELGAIGTVFLWCYAIASPIAGSLADRLSRSRTIVFSLVGWSVVTLLTGVATSMSQILFTRALLGFAEAAYLPAAIALIADYHSSKTRASAIGIHTAGLTFGLIAGGAGAGYLAEHFGWRLGFTILGMGGLVLAALAYWFLRDQTTAEDRTKAEPPPVLRSIGMLLKIPSVTIVFVQAMIVAVGTWIFLNWLPLYFKENYNLSLAAAGFAGTFMLQGAGTIGLVTGGYLSDAVAGSQPRRRMLLLTVCYWLAAPFLLAFLWEPRLAILNGSIFFFALFCRTGSTNETPLLCDLLAPKLRSTSIGLMNAANCFAGGVGVILAGAFKSTFGLGGVFGGITALIVVSSMLTWIGYTFFLKRDLARREKEVEATAVSYP